MRRSRRHCPTLYRALPGFETYRPRDTWSAPAPRNRIDQRKVIKLIDRRLQGKAITHGRQDATGTKGCSRL